MSIDQAWNRIESIQSMINQINKIGALEQPSSSAASTAPADSVFDTVMQKVQSGSIATGITGNTKAGSPGPAWVEKLIAEASGKYRVDKNLIRAVMRAESDFNPGSGSSAGAVGLMQVMPQYVKEQSGFTAQQVRTDNRANVFAGVAELAGYLKKYKGNIPLSLAAYNAGPGAVAKYGGIPPYKETQAYVKKICAELGVSPRP